MKMKDMISRNALFEDLQKTIGSPVDEKLYEVNLIIMRQPAVDAAPVRHGHWIYKRGCWAECSECHHDFNDVYDLENSDHYCRHCGAKMDGDAQCP